MKKEPAKSWLKEYYKQDKAVTYPDTSIYSYPDNHLNFRGAEKYLNNILRLLDKYVNGYAKVEFIKAQPCIYETNDYYHPYFWSYPGKIIIYANKFSDINRKTKYNIKKNINLLNTKYEFNCIIQYI